MIWSFARLFVVSLASGIGLILALAASDTRASEEADPNRVKGVVFDVCADCHSVPAYPSREPSPAADAPSFGDIAADPITYSNSRLRAFLRKPHFPMAGFVLSDRDIEDMIAFMRTQRE